MEDNPGTSGDPNPYSAYAGALFAAEQMKEHGGGNFVIVPYADDGDVDTARQIAG
ncbi:MAG TPA: hypothetical protein VIS72_06460 [Anaerolineales bacterium]